MNIVFKKSLLTICGLLEKYNVQYMLVGGAALALNGYFRHSINSSGELTEKPDIDIWYKPSYPNYFNLLKVIKSLGVDVTEFENEQSPNPFQSFFKLEFDDFTLDALPSIKANIKFADANARKETIEFDSIKIHYLNFVDLIEDKTMTAREKDILDIKQLIKIRGLE